MGNGLVLPLQQPSLLPNWAGKGQRGKMSEKTSLPFEDGYFLIGCLPGCCKPLQFSRDQSYFQIVLINSP
jgi:hypothetical protein